MFDLTQAFSLGKEIQANGEKWIVVHNCGKGLYLAVRADDKVPCQVFLVEEDTELNP